MGVRSDGLVKANEEFAAWLNGERSMPFGESGEHVTIRLIDFEISSVTNTSSQPNSPSALVPREARRPGAPRQRHPARRDRGEDAGPSKPELVDAAVQIHDDYEHNVPGSSCPTSFRRDRGQGVSLWLDRPAARPLGTLAIEQTLRRRR